MIGPTPTQRVAFASSFNDVRWRPGDDPPLPATLDGRRDLHLLHGAGRERAEARVCLFRERPRAPRRSQAIDLRRGAADRGQHRQAVPELRGRRQAPIPSQIAHKRGPYATHRENLADWWRLKLGGIVEQRVTSGRLDNCCAKCRC